METNDPLFSIITVSYNSAKTIEKTILSVLNQTYKNIEYIIIDGGSTDGTIDIIKKYQDKISYWVSEKDNGISDAFNKGILASSGEIIGIINSDDWYEKNAVTIIRDLDFKNKADLYIGALKYWKNKNTSIVILPDLHYKKTISFRMPHLNHPSSFIKKNTYDEIGLFNTRYKYAMDYDLFIRAYINNKKIIFTNKIISNMLTGGVSKINEKKHIKKYL
ncbi:MAG: glycosyltransferase family 2 protein [Candidatus Nomurabacteria bacterium]